MTHFGEKVQVGAGLIYKSSIGVKKMTPIENFGK